MDHRSFVGVPLRENFSLREPWNIPVQTEKRWHFLETLCIGIASLFADDFSNLRILVCREGANTELEAVGLHMDLLVSPIDCRSQVWFHLVPLHFAMLFQCIQPTLCGSRHNMEMTLLRHVSQMEDRKKPTGDTWKEVQGDSARWSS